MGLKTDFNQSPYFDDFDKTKNFHRVLFKPAVAVQARELTQLQTILQNQIERFGNNILTEGTIVSGGNFVEEKRLAYVKLLDIATNVAGAEVSTDVNQYINMKAVGLTNGVEGVIIATRYGLESQSPNLSTLYIKYTKFAVSNNQNVKAFVPGEAVRLYIRDANGDYTTPFHTVTVAPIAVDGAPVGTGYGVRCGDGIIYQKGHFIRFTDGLTIVSKYSSQPDGVVVGFQTTEEIVDSNADSSLLDNANGFNNENAPGADRLKLSPSLVVKTIEEADADDTFFAIQEYANGNIVRRKLTTQYNVIEKQMERRTSEESGDYVVDRFDVSVQTDTANTNNLKVVIDPGIAYVDGQRVELLNSLNIDLPEANTFGTVTGQDINANYGSYVIVNNFKGKFDTSTMETVNFYSAGNTTVEIGTSRVRSVAKQVDGNYRLYLQGTKMKSSAYTFADVVGITSASGGSANTVLVSGNAVLKDETFNKLFFPIGKSFVKAIDSVNTDFVYRAFSANTINTNSLTLTVTSPDVFPYTPSSSLNSDELLDIIVVANSASGGGITSGESIGINSASLDSTGRNLTVTLAKNPGTNLVVNSYYSVKKKQVSIRNKELKTVYIKIQANTATNGVNGPWSLGMADAYELLGVWRGTSATSWATLENNAANNETTNSVSDSFRIDSNQNDSIYDLSTLNKKKPITIGANDKIIVKAKVFTLNNTGTGHFFTVDSYPINDTTIPLPSDKIRTENIPSFKSSDGNTYDLRDVIDLRPYVSNTAAYAIAPADATINPTSTQAFANLLTPAPNKSIESNYSYYLGRNDIVIVDKNGNFELVQGTPSENPSYPQEPTKGMLLARINVPPFPTLSTAAAQRLRKPQYGVGVSSNQTQRYTMKDIAGIDKRIKNLEYYTSLSLLESKTKDLLVTDANGNERFKNGIFVENFETLYFADVNGGEFAAAVDTNSSNVTPKIRQYPLALKLRSTTSAVNNASKFATLAYTETVMPSVSQNFATNVKNCTTTYYNYVGKMQIYPPYDSGPDTKIAPDVNFSIDLATPFIEFTEALSEFVPLTRTEVERLGNIETTTTSTLVTTEGQAVTQNVGDFVRDVSFSPFIRAQRIEVSVVGLRPNTRFYLFFDGYEIQDGLNGKGAAAQAAVGEDGLSLVRTGAFGAPIKSDAEGRLYAIMHIFENSFYVGDRKVEVMDVSNVADREAATSYASAVFSAFNFSVTKSGLSVITRPPQFEIDVEVTERNLGGGGSDPIAQTFIIDKTLSNDTDVFVTKLDLFFARKSRAGKGVGVQIREVINGYPAGKALPFSSVHLSAAQVNAPTNRVATTAATPTTVTFEGPVALKVDTEYAIVVAPDGNDPDYLLWISRTGETDVDTAKAVSQDTNAGVLFTSTNNRTWTPYQDENLKFKLYKATFSPKEGSVKLTNKDHEFFSIENINGQFQDSEQVFPIKTVFNAGTVSVTSGSRAVVGSGTTFQTSYQVNDYIIIKNGTLYEAHKIKTITSNTAMTLNGEVLFTASGLSHYAAPVGTLIYVNSDEPPRMILERSSARNAAGMTFVAAQTVYGESSGATADITSVDNLPISYIQPNIYRSNFTKTRTTLQASELWNGSSTVSKDLAFNNTNFLTDNAYYIKSKSNSPSTSNFVLDVNMKNVSTSNNPETSPVVDYDISSVMVAEYIVNAANTTNDIDGSELIGLGESKARYVSKVITLADGLDAEDIRVYLSAYRPTGTDVRVYVRFKSATDNRPMNTIEWTRLALKPESDSTSSIANRYDYREYEYALGTTSKTVGQGAWDNSGVINYIAPIDGNNVKFTNFKYFAIKIVMLSNSHAVVPRVNDIRAIAVT